MQLFDRWQLFHVRFVPRKSYHGVRQPIHRNSEIPQSLRRISYFVVPSQQIDDLLLISDDRLGDLGLPFGDQRTPRTDDLGQCVEQNLEHFQRHPEEHIGLGERDDLNHFEMPVAHVGAVVFVQISHGHLVVPPQPRGGIRETSELVFGCGQTKGGRVVVELAIWWKLGCRKTLLGARERVEVDH